MAECNHCGGFVTDDYARVFGDNENRIEDCRNCPTVRATDDDEGEDGREVLLREVRETAGRERDDAVDRGDDRGHGETAVEADETERHEADVRVEASGTAESVGDIGASGSGPDDVETDTSAVDAGPEGEDDEDDDDDTGSRIQSSLSAMVSAFRS